MDSFISESDCQRILEIEFPDRFIKILRYRFEDFEDIGEGFLSTTKKLVIEFSSDDSSGKSEMSFFTKMLPQSNKFHQEYVLSTQGFAKEVFFFDKIKPNLDLWSRNAVIPKCYLAVPDKILVLELMIDFYTKDLSEYFSKNEIMSALKSLAVLHSASLMCESKNGIHPHSVWGDHFFETLYLKRDGHLGFQHTIMGITAIKAIMDKHYEKLDKNLKKHLYSIYDNLSEHVLPSTKYRNVISHGDLYTNNVMFFKSSTDQVESRIVDFQLFRFCPPALDILMLIYFTTDATDKTIDVNDLTDHYYNCMTSIMAEFGFQVQTELLRDEFKESLKAYRSLALAITLLFQHFVNLPPTELTEIMEDEIQLRKFVLEDRLEVVLSSFESDNNYRSRLEGTIKLLIESCTNDLK